MSDNFLLGLSATVSEVERRARELFGALDYERFNRSPQPGSWSIGQCLDHLVKANEPYFAIFDSVANGTKQTMFWERLPILPKIFGATVLNTVHPTTVRKSKAPRIFQPTTSNVPLAVREAFLQQQHKFVDAFTSLRGVDLDVTIVTSPVARFIPYNLRDALSIVVAHEERHMQQAERVLPFLK